MYMVNYTYIYCFAQSLMVGSLPLMKVINTVCSLYWTEWELLSETGLDMPQGSVGVTNLFTQSIK